LKASAAAALQNLRIVFNAACLRLADRMKNTFRHLRGTNAVRRRLNE